MSFRRLIPSSSTPANGKLPPVSICETFPGARNNVICEVTEIASDHLFAILLVEDFAAPNGDNPVLTEFGLMPENPAW